MNENTYFEQDYWSTTAKTAYKIGHDSFRLMKWVCYYEKKLL